MPHISERLRECVFYLYEDEHAALNNEEFGGTGFFVFVSSKTGREADVYAITNHHVIKDDFTVIRVSKNTGEPATIPLKASNWLEHPESADVCAASITLEDDSTCFTALPSEWLLTKDQLQENYINLGSDVYMMGRFISHAGKTVNKPIARSGIISAFPDTVDLVKLKGMPPQEAFIIEMRSLSGYSGSPTFYNLESWYFINHLIVMMDTVFDIQVPASSRYVNRPELATTVLGIDAGSFPMFEDVYRMDGDYREPTAYKAQNHTGFSIVIPAWKIIETLNRPEFVMEREKKDKEYLKEHKYAANTDSKKREKPLTANEFEDYLRQVSRKTSEPVSEKKETSE
jgi:hypothetical protein